MSKSCKHSMFCGGGDLWDSLYICKLKYGISVVEAIRTAYLFRQANHKLQDTNDNLLMIMDSGGGGRSPICYSPASSVDSAEDHLRKPKW